MGYTALYRKFRPQNFEDVKGQEHIVTTLKNQIKADRIGHAYLFCGTRGTGKTTIAKILAKAVNCENPVDGSPCNECATCRAINEGTSMNVIEIDAASNNGVDNIREIREEVAYRPTQGKYKVYIIDEVHMLSTGAFNALLKTLEEPPSYVMFILATTEAHKIPITILSRCQRYDFRRITADTISARLMELMDKEGNDVEEKAIRYIAKAADGSMRDALSLLDQCIAFYLGEKLTYEKVLENLGAVDTEIFSGLLRKILAQDTAGAIKTLEDIIIQGREMGQFVTDFIWYLRNLLLIATSDNAEEAVDASAETLARMKEESQMADAETLMRYIRIFSELSNQIKYASQKRVLVEIALIKLCQPVMETNLDSLYDRVRVLEEKLQSGAFMQAIPTGMNPQMAGQIQGYPGAPGKFNTGNMPGGFGAGMQAEELSQTAQPEKKPEKAAPEDLQYVRKNWNSIIRETKGLLQQMLLESTPKYDGNTGEPVLYVEFRNFLAQTCIDNPENLEMLKNAVRKKIGKDVEIKMILKDSESGKSQGGLSEISVDDLLEQNVHMEITVENMEEDE
ncbi:MAG TPA: DNA polymerase III subunit gamma/tau [Candidatus Blautia stercoravium]|nr:DNA polymerase III subunit gamma/tau [Candidatus Blautia stercoravium]